MRYLYTILLYLMTPLIILRLYWKSRRLPAYRHRIGERFSFYKNAAMPVDIWLHAVSLGEVVAATPLIQALLKKNLRILVTTMTPTGSQQVLNRFGTQVVHHYVPYDLPWVLRRFFKKFKPRVAVIMETELWPNMIHQANRYKVPILLVNARLSDRAFKQYIKLRFMFKPVLNQFTAILAQSQQDAARFIDLGATSQRVKVAGNLKFDVPPVVVDENLHAFFLNAWGSDRVVLIAASTHEGEEEAFLSRWATLKSAIPHLLLLIAPRHPERFQTVYQLCQRYSSRTGLRSQPQTIDENSEVIVLDSLGELMLFYSMSDYAFVGGSLVPVGGHNVLEPIAVNVPVLCGPYMNNSKSICDDLCRANALEKALDADDLINKLIDLYQNPTRRQAQISNATAVLNANRGTLARLLEQVFIQLKNKQL